MNVEKAVETLPFQRGEFIWKLYEQLKTLTKSIHQQYKELNLSNQELYLFDGNIKTKNFILIDFDIRKECTLFQKGLVGLHLDAKILLDGGFANRTLYNIMEYELFTSISRYNLFCTTSTDFQNRKAVEAFNNFTELTVKQILNTVS